jgi:hypothetical protein
MNKFYSKISDFFNSEKGEINMIAIVALAVVVLVVVAIFRTQLSDLVTNIFGRINDMLPS